MGALLNDKELLGRLVEFESVSRRGNLEIADFVCDYLDRPGVHVTRIDSADGTRRNVVAATGGPARDGGGLVLSGHLDVVPADEPDWDSDPFKLEERADRYVARGACDMKGFVALAMNRFVRWAADSLVNPLMLALTYDEELGSLGAQRLAEVWGDRPPLPRATIIGEPTSLRAVRMHKGHVTMRIEVTGAPAHSGSPHLGQNAIEDAGRVLAALADLRAELEQERTETSEFFPTVPYPVLNVARIDGGAALNVVPDRCTIDVGLRPLPGQQSSALVDAVRGRVRAASSHREIDVSVTHDNPPMLLPPEAPIYRTLCDLLGQSETIGVSFASDAGFLRRRLGLETVLMGPGSIEVAHRPNEFVPIDEFRRAGRILDDLVPRLCEEGVRA
ncbi:MAG: acetylornithine deacetylase [Planctomycetota bacterium]|jgi:acetylornithine deacetylase